MKLEQFLYLIIFLIPTYLVRFELFGIPTNTLEVLVGVAFVAVIAMKFKTTIQNLKSLFTDYYLLITGIALIFLGLIIGIFVSPDTRASLGALKGWFLTPLIFFIISKTVLVEDEQKQKALLTLFLSGTITAFLHLILWLQGVVTFDNRLGGFYNSPNALAMYLAPAFLIGSIFLIQRRNRFSLSLFLPPILLIGFIIFQARSLGAFLSILGALTLTYCVYLWGKERKSLWIYLYSIVIIGILLPFTSSLFNPWEMGRTSLASRLMIWQASVAILKDNWLAGIGPGVFQETYLTYQKNFPPYLEWAVPHPHNIFLATWLYGGILGLVGFLLILWWFFQSIRERFSGNFYKFLLISINFYIIIHGFIDNTLWRNDVLMIFWITIALIKPFVVRRWS